MFCPKCGKDASVDAKFCENCGTAMNSVPSAQPAYQAEYYAPQSGPQYPPNGGYGPQPAGYGPQPMYGAVPMKSSGVAAILAILIPGLGHIYVGKITDGIIYLILAIVLGFLLFLIVPIILLLVLWIWQIYDAYNKANEYNAAVQQTGRAPW